MAVIPEIENHKGLRVTCKNGRADGMKIFNAGTGEEVDGITSIKMDCSVGNVVSLELKAFAMNGFDINVLPENVTIKLER